jgi:myo-inositol-1(or 4)-monophosphatase
MTLSDVEIAKQAAVSAGEILLGFWQERESLKVTNKRAGDFVSRADFKAEEHLKNTLLSNSPSDGWLGEETGSSGERGRRWIVDPLDGTTNFLRGIPHWSVSVGLEVDGNLTLGVIHDPVNKETFIAERGKGATLNAQPIKVSNTENFASALFGTGIPFGGMPNIDHHAREIARLMPKCAGVRRMGSAALDLAYVACGRLDGFWERGLQQWDIAAGLVIASESGATITGWDEQDDPGVSGNVLTATPGLYSDFHRLIVKEH